MNKKAILAALAIGMTAGMALPALAGDTTLGQNQVAVYYGDLNLQTAAGQEVLKARMRAAAESVCPNQFARDLTIKIAGRRCVRQAVEAGMGDVSERQMAKAAALSVERG